MEKNLGPPKEIKASTWEQSTYNRGTRQETYLHLEKLDPMRVEIAGLELMISDSQTTISYLKSIQDLARERVREIKNLFFHAEAPDDNGE